MVECSTRGMPGQVTSAVTRNEEFVYGGLGRLFCNECAPGVGGKSSVKHNIFVLLQVLYGAVLMLFWFVARFS